MTKHVPSVPSIPTIPQIWRFRPGGGGVPPIPAPVAANAIPPQSIVVGEAFSISVAGDFAGGGPVSDWSVVSLPVWASLNTTTAIVSGTATEAWSGAFGIRGANSSGYDDTAFAVTAIVVGVPVITSYVLDGGALTIAVDLDGTVSTLIDADGTADAAEIIADGDAQAVTAGSPSTIEIELPTTPGAYWVNSVPYVSAGSPGAVARALLVVEEADGPVVLYDEDFTGGTWQSQVDGVNIFDSNAGLVTEIFPAGEPTVSEGTTGYLRVDGNTEYIEHFITLPLRHPDWPHDLIFRGEWITTGATANGCFRIRWVDDTGAVVSGGEVFRMPSSGGFGNENRLLDHTGISNTTPPAGATKLRIGFFSDGTQNPRWGRGEGRIFRILFKETGA